MSTRAVVNFYNEYEVEGQRQNRDARGRFASGKELVKVRKLNAKIYRHGDGYPDGLGKDLQTFLDHVKATLKDTRFNDASYLAAKWVVWDAGRMAKYQSYDCKTDEYLPVTNPLNFLSVGIMMEDPGDIEYSYDVICNSDWGVAEKMPTIICNEISF